MVITRLLLSILVGVLILNETLSYIELFGLSITMVGILLYLRVKNNNNIKDYNLALGVILSISSGVTFVVGQYYFKIYSQNLSGLTSGYILELSSIPFLFFFILIHTGIQKKKLKHFFKLKLKDYFYIFLFSTPALLGSYGLAKSYFYLDFILVNILFSGILVLAGVFGYIFLKEKLTKLQIIIFFLILIGIFIVNYF